MPKIDERLVIYTKIENLIKYSKIILNKFPKTERYVLSTSILNNLYQSLEYVLRAYKERKKEEKLKYLKEVDIELYKLQTNVKIAYSLAYITRTKF